MKMTNKKTLIIVILSVLTLLLISTSSAQITSEYIYGRNISESCTEGQDFIIEVPPGACQPAVVRSDLLEEQSVPVYCNIIGIKVNPLIDVPYIRSITPLGFTSTKDVAGIHFYPAKASLRALPGMIPEGTPSSINNLGWLVVLLKQKTTEKEIPEKIELNLTARIKYDMQNSFGIAESELTLTEMNENEWEKVSERYSFWRGKGYVRAARIDENTASFVVYDSSKRSKQTINVKVGETSQPAYLTGFYCAGGVKLNLEKIDFPSVKARLNVNGIERLLSENMQLYEGSKCRISKINSGISPNIEISCPEEKYTLSLNPREASLNVNGKEKRVKIGEKISDGETSKVFLGYVGIENDTKYIVVFQGDEKDAYRKIIEIKKGVELLHAKGKSINELKLENVEIISNDSEKEVDGIKIKIIGDLITLKTKIYSENIEDNFRKAIASAKDVADKYGNVKDDIGDIYGLKALKDAANLARELGKEEEQVDLLREIIKKYSNENISEEKIKLDRLISSESSSISFFDKSTGQSVFVVLEDINIPDKTDAFATIIIDGEQTDKGVGDAITNIWYISKITDRCINVASVRKDEAEKTLCKDSSFLLVDSAGKSVNVKLLGTKLKKEAYVRLIPFSKEGETITNFSVQIGIEKRAVQLSPEQMKEHIRAVNEISMQLENFINQLSFTVKQWKLACFATQAGLAVKNLVLTPQGEARRAAMHGMTINGKQYGGWTDFCKAKIGDPSVGGKFRDLDACYRYYADQINADVSVIKKSIEETNDYVKNIKAQNLVNGKLKEEAYIKNALNNSGNERLKELVRNENFNELISRGIITKEDVKEMIFLHKIQEKCKNPNSPLCKGEKDVKNFSTIFDDLLNYNFNRLSQIDTLKKSTSGAIGPPEFWETPADFAVSPIMIKARVYDANSFERVLGNDANRLSQIMDELKSNKNYRVSAGVKNNEAFFVLLERTIDGRFKPVKVYNKSSGEDISSAKLGDISNFRIDGIDTNDWKYSFSREVKPEVRFWEEGKYKGFAAIVPFEINGAGYYVKMNKQDYEENGFPRYLNIYNVGSNGRIDEGSGDDISVQSLAVSQITSEMELANKALQAVRNANAGYGSRTISILGKMYGVGKAMIDVPAYQCQDFMSPSDCSILFNVCDPVLCPPSRCNLGGTYQTANVVQSGVIGSIVLCSKNSVLFGGDVILPVCLTGLNAGLQNINTVLKSYRDCLNESLTTGKNVGICDEIYSIYLCELTWREVLPFITYGIPNIVTSMLHQGGGEYLNFQSNWNNFVGTINYFTSQYAETAFEAFKIRSTMQVGTEVCKLFFSLRYPDLIELVDRLTKPESPPQFFAYFDEISFTSVTVPATSQYKIYYHIYAGEDKGISYNVYLSSPPYVTGIYIPPIQFIDAGFLPQGQYKSETKDILAPAGYKELCIEIDGKRECGFGRVGTQFSLNYLADKYVQQQLTENIDSEKECISGSVSLLPLVPGLHPGQEGIVEAIKPSLERRGVTRICSKDNPGKGVNEAKWDFVGWCNKNEKFACWVDRESVEGAIKDLGILNETLNYSASLVSAYLEEEGMWTKEKAAKEINTAKTQLTNAKNVGNCLDAVKKFSEIEDNSFFLNQKAEAALGIAASYAKKVRLEVESYKK
ncbi:MAG: hypothetical protein QW041_01495 [Candidatus Pacearchaeota archaeon]